MTGTAMTGTATTDWRAMTTGGHDQRTAHATQPTGTSTHQRTRIATTSDSYKYGTRHRNPPHGTRATPREPLPPPLPARAECSHPTREGVGG